MKGSGGIELLIIADDLTGSNDAGAQFAKRGIRSVVVATPDLAELPKGFPVVVVNSESRHIPADEAAGRIARIARLGVDAGARHYFKKTDSTLRGNIGAELKALLEATGARWLPFVPAFPEMGRTTRDGIHYVHGVAISESAFSKDPLSPVRESEVAKVLAANATIRVLSAKLGNLPLHPEADCVIVDCATREELGAIAREFKARDQLRVMAGSAAFAEELPNVLRLPKTDGATSVARGPILCVNGSLNPRALEQIAAAAELFRKVKLSPGQLLQCELSNIAFSGNENVLLCSVEDRMELGRYESKAHELGILPERFHLEVAKRQGKIVREILESGTFQTLVVFGGDTLMGVARAMGWEAFEPSGEVEAGVTVAVPRDEGLTVVTKAGGFGDVDVLRRIFWWVRH